MPPIPLNISMQINKECHRPLSQRLCAAHCTHRSLTPDKVTVSPRSLRGLSRDTTGQHGGRRKRAKLTRDTERRCLSLQVAFETCGVSGLAPATSDPGIVQQRWSPKASLQQELIEMAPHGSSWDGFLTQLTLFHSSPHSSGQPLVFIHSLIRLFAYIIKHYLVGSHTFSVSGTESRLSWDRTEL